MSINGMISIRALFFGTGEDSLISRNSEAPVMVKVMGMLTLETVPGLNRHDRNALVAALSRIGLPVLDETLQPLTLPLPESTVQTITPLPVTCRERAS